MAAIINAGTSGPGGIQIGGDASGVLQLQTASNTAVSIDTSQNLKMVQSSSQILNSNGRPMASQTGGIIQTVGGSVSTTTVNNYSNSGAYASTGISQSITPQSTSSKVLITFMCLVQVSGGSNNQGGGLTIYRNGSNLVTAGGTFPTMAFIQNPYEGSGNMAVPVTLTWLDSPASTSSTTYTIYTMVSGGVINIPTMPQNMTSVGYTFILQEIAG